MKLRFDWYITKNQMRFGSGFINKNYINEIGVHSYTAGIRCKKYLCVETIQLDMINQGGSLHLLYKPLESTLSDGKLFIEIVFAENLSRPNA